MREPTGQQKIFIDEYLRGRKSNATQAAILAGYSPKHADTQACHLLKNPQVLNYLKEKESAISQELQNEFIFDAVAARKVMYEILNNVESRDTDRINVAKDFLDRAGFKPTDKVEHSGGISITERAEFISKYLGVKDDK